MNKNLSLTEITALFPDDAAAEEWFVEARWPEGVHCPHCGSARISERATRHPQRWRCKDCRKDFSPRTGSLLHASNLDYRTWVMAIYLMSTHVKGVSSLQLHRDLGVTQSTAWLLAHKIRETWAGETPRFEGPVEVDETYIGGLERNKHSNKKLYRGSGSVGKVPVIGIKDRPSNRVVALPLPVMMKFTMQKFITDHVKAGAKVYTDEHAGYHRIPYFHRVVKHSHKQYVRGMAHTNGIESFWAVVKRAYKGTYHYWSAKHLHRYVLELVAKQNDRPLDTMERMRNVARRMSGRRLTYRDLIA